MILFVPWDFRTCEVFKSIQDTSHLDSPNFSTNSLTEACECEYFISCCDASNRSISASPFAAAFHFWNASKTPLHSFFCASPCGVSIAVFVCHRCSPTIYTRCGSSTRIIVHSVKVSENIGLHTVSILEQAGSVPFQYCCCTGFLKTPPTCKSTGFGKTFQRMFSPRHRRKLQTIGSSVPVMELREVYVKMIIKLVSKALAPFIHHERFYATSRSHMSLPAMQVDQVSLQ